MEKVVLRLLRRDPDERFASARDLKDALQRVAAGGEAQDAGSLRIVTDPPGAEVSIRTGRRTVAEGPTPCVANALGPGTYKVSLRDPRYEPIDTTVTLAAGAMEDLTLVTTPRSGGLGAAVLRRRGRIAVAAALILVAAGSMTLQPWGRTLELADLQARAAEDGVTDVRVTAEGIEGRLPIGPIEVPFRVRVGEEEVPGAVARLRTAGLAVDTSWEVARLIAMAASAQSRTRYFGHEGEDVRSYAERAVDLDPESAEARSLLLKVAEHMAWDAAAARQDGSADVAERLVRECLALMPEHPGCEAAAEGG